MLKPCGVAFILAFFAFATSALGQAFGIEKGTAIDSLTVMEDLGNGHYKVSVPSPHPEFESYVVKSTPETGVCLVRGVGKDHENDRFGDSVRRAFGELKSALDVRYGGSETFDFLKRGALWDAQHEWVMAIRQNERHYQSSWDDESNASLTAGLEEILLTISALSSDSAWIALQYRFDNDEKCSALIAKESESGL